MSTFPQCYFWFLKIKSFQRWWDGFFSLNTDVWLVADPRLLRKKWFAFLRLPPPQPFINCHLQRFVMQNYNSSLFRNKVEKCRDRHNKLFGIFCSSGFPNVREGNLRAPIILPFSKIAFHQRVGSSAKTKRKVVCVIILFTQTSHNKSYVKSNYAYFVQLCNFGVWI